MATTVAFALLDRLVDLYTTRLPTVHVVDGDTVSDDVGTWLMVGWDDPDNDRATAATAAQSWAGLGAKARDEEGTVTCLVVVTKGSNSLKDVRATVKAVTDAVEDIHRDDPNLGGTVPGLMWTGYGTRTELRQWLSDMGAVATCTFDIAYKARI
jgi:hypothetical protein